MTGNEEDEWEDTDTDVSDCKEDEENMIPPQDVVKFGDVEMDREYREALYREHPYYTAEEIVGTYLGHNPHYPGG